MTNEEAKKMLEAKLKCLTRETSGTDIDCNHRNCDECSLCYEQGNMGEQKEALDMAIKALKIVQGIEDAYMRELLKTPLERGVPISDACDGCRYELNSTNGNPCYSCGKHKEGK